MARIRQIIQIKMKILLSWLKDYIDLDLSTSLLVEKLNLTGTEVESVTEALDERVIVAKIKKINKHPNADRLQIATVFDGEKNLTVVCGANNIHEGQIAPLAQIGAKLGDVEIKRSEIRGVESEGMLCAQDELGLGDDHSGIIDLPKDYEVGKTLNYYMSKDATLELEITPNRGDCLSHVGVAREIAAFTDQVLVKKPVSLPMSSTNVKDALTVEIEDLALCPQYMARVIEGVKIAPSPQWLCDRLIAIGQKPINNIVDATNYIMYDLGQPLHAFDAEKIENKKIIVRSAKARESIVTLDGAERKLNGALVIADAKKPIAIAGIMGGKNSEVTEGTTKIILESAEFDRKSIRKSKKDLDLTTEASYRFERGIDSGGVEYALNKAVALIKEIAGGAILSGIASDGKRPGASKVKIEYKKINNLCDLELGEAEINKFLKNVGFAIEKDEAIVPLWRHDIEAWQDLTEEVARLYGYNKIDPIPVPQSALPKKSDFYCKEALKNVLINFGFSEVINYPYLSETDVKKLKLDDKKLLEIASPIQPENKYLRQSLMPGLLKSIAKNPSFDQVFIFEIGRVFNQGKESTHLAIAAAGRNAKEAAEKINASGIGIKMAELAKDILNAYKIRKPVVYFVEVDLSGIMLKFTEKELYLSGSKKKIIYHPVSKFPSVTRDLAFIVNKSIKTELIEQEISIISDSINRVELFDEFASDKLGVGNKNIAYHIYLQKMERTMTDVEAELIVKEIIKKIEKQFKAKLRS